MFARSSSARYRRHYGSIATGITVGPDRIRLVGHRLAARHSFDIVQIEAGSFVVPVADTLLQFITFTGILPDYGVGLVVGVGRAPWPARWKRDVRWEACDDARE